MKYPFLPAYAIPRFEKFLFPFSPIDAVRHWKKGTLGHRIIAVLMHVPILGPLFALGERAAFVAQKHFTQQHMDKKQKDSVPPPAPLNEKKIVLKDNPEEKPQDPAGSGSKRHLQTHLFLKQKKHKRH